MNKIILNEISRMNELMGIILEQSLSDVQSGGKVIQKGSKGDSVKQIQTALKINPDGVFGDGTEQAVKKFQQDNGLTPDGKIGKNTLSKMVSVLKLSVSGPATTASAAFNAGKIFGENIKETIVTISDITFVIIMAPFAFAIYIGQTIIHVTKVFGDLLLKFINELVELGVATVKTLAAQERQMREAIRNALIKANIKVKEGAQAVWKGIQSLVDGTITVFTYIFNALWSKGKKIYGQALMLAAKIYAAHKTMIEWLGKQWVRVKDAVGETWDSVIQGINTGANWVKNKVSQTTGAVQDFFSGFMSVFENYLRNEKLLYERPLDERLIIMEYNSRKKLILN